MYETIRIVGKLRPKYVMWENVKNLLSAKHKHNFDAYIETMNILGYNSYYQVLNAKDYGIPQNRERVYTISIRKDIDNENFVFPDKEDLVLRLKDMLEDKVDEKYYLKDYQLENIKKSNYIQNQRRIQEKEYCDTLCARDWKDPKCVRVGGIFDTENSKHQAGSIYDKEGLAPTLDAMQGGWRQPSIIEDKLPGAYGRDFGSKGKIQDKESSCDTLQAAMGNGGGNIPIIKEEPKIEVVGNYSPSNHDASRIVDKNGLAPTVKENHGTITATNIDYRIRKLTPKECWRLMGFDDEDFEKAAKVNSNTQLYKQARKFNLCTSFRKNTC